MLVTTILNGKGSDVVSVSPSDTISVVAAVLSAKRIGAALVRDPNGAVLGIISERDIVDGIAQSRGDCLDMQARDLMTADLLTCSPDDTVDELMQKMTERRVRHLPVMKEGVLIGIVSIGDLVKSRISELKSEGEAMRAYIASG